MRTLVPLTTGHCAADRHLQVFQAWLEKNIFSALEVSR